MKKFHIRCAYFTPNCTWSLNYSVLVKTVFCVTHSEGYVWNLPFRRRFYCHLATPRSTRWQAAVAAAAGDGRGPVSSAYNDDLFSAAANCDLFVGAHSALAGCAVRQRNGRVAAFSR
jgi:hypothetical protein